MKKFFSFFISKVFFLNLIIAIIVIIVIIKLTLLFLANYSHHGEKIKVPNLTNLSLQAAKQKLGILDLKCVVADSSYHRTIKPGNIIKQQPLPKAFVKKNRTIMLTMATQNPEKVSLHTTKDMSLRQAISMFNSLGLDINQLIYKPSYFSNLVLGFELNGEPLSSGDKILKYTKIDVIIGKKYGYTTTTPKLKNKTLNDAIFQTHSAGLNVGKLYFSTDVKTYTDSVSAVVYKQSISPGVKVIPGKKVDIYLQSKS